MLTWMALATILAVTAPQEVVAQSTPGTDASQAPALAVPDDAWIQRPAPNFPQRAQSRRVFEGVVQMTCEVAPSGDFRRCDVLSESTRGAGFGQAAVEAMQQARFRITPEGPQPGDRSPVSIRFYFPPDMR